MWKIELVYLATKLPNTLIDMEMPKFQCGSIFPELKDSKEWEIVAVYCYPALETCSVHLIKRS